MPPCPALYRSALCLLWLLSLPAYAQEKQIQIFSDFENGSWGGWTVEGQAFGDIPATNAQFPGKIHGYSGEGFVCTLHPRRGNAAVGKAVSPEFSLEKAVIRFKIGGGYHPGETCLNLVVGGEVVRTATGNGMADLTEAEWKVGDFLGKKAHLEIIDSSTSPQRGYILVDDIRFVKGKEPKPEFPSPLPETTPVIEIPLRIVHILDAYGDAEFVEGNRSVITPEIAEKQIAAVNDLFLPAKIRFTLAPQDLELRRSDYLNADYDFPAAPQDLTNRAVRPAIRGGAEHLAAFQKIGLERLDRITLLAHRGSEWRWEETQRRWKWGGGYSHGGGSLSPDGSAVIRLCTLVPRVWAHELGHNLGLPHTSRDGIDSPSNLQTEAAICAAMQDYIRQCGDDAHPEYAIDGDYHIGVWDTPPDPGLGFWGESKQLTATLTVRLPGREPFPLLVSRNNIMAAKPDSGSFTKDQITVMRRNAEEWKAKIRLRGNAAP